MNEKRFLNKYGELYDNESKKVLLELEEHTWVEGSYYIKGLDDLCERLNNYDEENKKLGNLLTEKVKELNSVYLFIIQKGLMEEFVRCKDD